jgi:hypothetical protein
MVRGCFFFNDTATTEIYTLTDTLSLHDALPIYIEELNDLYCSPNTVRVIKSRIMRWVGHVARMGERRSVYRVLVEKPEGKRPLGRPRRRWEDNIKIDLLKVGVRTGLIWLRIGTGGGHL